MAFELMKGRLLVLLDDGENDRGIVFESNLGGYRGLVMPCHPPEDPEDPCSPIEYYDHVVFIKEMSMEIIVDDVSYQVMHRDALIGILTD